MHKPVSSTSFSRSVLGARPTEKENSSLSSNTNAIETKAYNLMKYKKETSQNPSFIENPEETNAQKNNKQNNKSFIQSSENTKINLINKSQEIISKEFKKNAAVEKVKKNNEKVERKGPRATTLMVRDNNLSFINNVPTSKPTTTITYYDNFIKKNKNDQGLIQKEEKPSSISSLFPTILENLHLSNCSNSQSETSISYNESENMKLTKFYAKEIMDTLVLKDVKIINFYFFKIFEKNLPPKNFLEFHKIPYHLRSRMIDWMVEVLFSYKCQDQTFFLAVSIMDSFFKNSKMYSLFLYI